MTVHIPGRATSSAPHLRRAWYLVRTAHGGGGGSGLCPAPQIPEALRRQSRGQAGRGMGGGSSSAPPTGLRPQPTRQEHTDTWTVHPVGQGRACPPHFLSTRALGVIEENPREVSRSGPVQGSREPGEGRSLGSRPAAARARGASWERRGPPRTADWQEGPARQEVASGSSCADGEREEAHPPTPGPRAPCRLGPGRRASQLTTGPASPKEAPPGPAALQAVLVWTPTRRPVSKGAWLAGGGRGMQAGPALPQSCGLGHPEARDAGCHRPSPCC